eukprot:285476-Alexandrium_andersonii.AAC.1
MFTRGSRQGANAGGPQGLVLGPRLLEQPLGLRLRLAAGRRALLPAPLANESAAQDFWLAGLACRAATPRPDHARRLLADSAPRARTPVRRSGDGAVR